MVSSFFTSLNVVATTQSFITQIQSTNKMTSHVCVCVCEEQVANQRVHFHLVEYSDKN